MQSFRFWMLTLALVGSGLLALLNTTMIGASMPAIIAELNLSPGDVHWLSTGYLLAATIAIPVQRAFRGMGNVANRHGDLHCWILGV
jgi:MFS family permease